MNDAGGDIACVIMDLSESRLLLPSVAVTEVLRMKDLVPVAHRPAWVLGAISWRRLLLPLISVEHLVSPPKQFEPPAFHSPILILGRTQIIKGLGFYAVLARSMPGIRRVTRDNLKEMDGPAGLCDARWVRVGREQAMVPNIHKLGALIARFRLRRRT